MSDAPGDPPPAVAAHLLRCASCQEVQERLLVVDRAAAEFFTTPGGEAAKQRFLARFGQLAPLEQDATPPPVALPTPPPLPPPLPAVRPDPPQLAPPQLPSPQLPSPQLPSPQLPSPQLPSPPAAPQWLAYLAPWGVAAAILLVAGLSWLAFADRGAWDAPVANNSPPRPDRPAPAADDVETPDARTPTDALDPAEPLAPAADALDPAEPLAPAADALAGEPGAADNDVSPPESGEDPPPLLDSILENHLLLAAAHTPEDRLALVEQLSARIWQEVLTYAPTLDAAELTQLGDLYERVVAASLQADAAAALADDAPVRTALIDNLRRRSRQAEIVAAQLAARESAAEAAILLRMGASSRRAAEQWAGEAPPAAIAFEAPPPETLVAQIVEHSVKLAGETDVIRRAAHCSVVANQLSQSIEATSRQGETQQSERLGGYLGDIIDFGVMANLEAYTPTGPDDPRQAEIELVKQRGQFAREDLERQLDAAPEKSREGLERALKASKKERDKGPSQGKGPPHGKGPPAIFPPLGGEQQRDHGPPSGLFPFGPGRRGP